MQLYTILLMILVAWKWLTLVETCCHKLVLMQVTCVDSNYSFIILYNTMGYLTWKKYVVLINTLHGLVVCFQNFRIWSNAGIYAFTAILDCALCSPWRSTWEFTVAFYTVYQWFDSTHVNVTSLTSIRNVWRQCRFYETRCSTALYSNVVTNFVQVGQ